MNQTIVSETRKVGMNRFLIFFGIGFLLGIVIGNFLIPSAGGEAGVMSAYFLDKFEYMDIEYNSLFVYIFEKRMKIYMVLMVCGVTSFGCVLAYSYTIWLGVSTGAFVSICILRLGIWGIPVGAISLLPQYLLYVPVYVFLIWRIKENQKLLLNCNGKREKQKLWVKYFLMMAVAGILLLGGIFLESNVNPFLMKKILKFV